MKSLYSVENGVMLSRELIDTNVTTLDPIVIAAEDFAPFNKDTLAQNTSDHTMAHSLVGRLGVQVINSGKERLAITAPAWGGSFESPITNLENQSLATCLDNHTVVGYNMPGHGDEYVSLPWSKTVRQGLRLGSFLAAGRYVGTFLNQKLRDYEHVDVLGFSTGGRLALGMPSSLNSRIDTMVVFDPPGSQQMTYKEFARQYKGIEGEHSANYRQASTDTHLQTLVAQSPRHKRKGIQANIRNGSLVDYYVREPAALARGGLEEDLRQANLHQVNRLVFISPEQSALNTPESIQGILKRTAKAHPDTRIEHIRFSGTHAFSRLGSVAIARLYEMALNLPSV